MAPETQQDRPPARKPPAPDGKRLPRKTRRESSTAATALRPCRKRGKGFATSDSQARRAGCGGGSGWLTKLSAKENFCGSRRLLAESGAPD
jgi:hypothetical protein